MNWQTWSDELIEYSIKNDKLLIISIGYSSCHWCHVMEHESFSDKEVADIMNRDFISIKVDREERPDIDQVYMNSALLMTGHGGWPLNIIALPDGRAVFAGTYFHKDTWISILKKVSEIRGIDKTELIKVADSVMNGLENMELLSPAGTMGYDKKKIYLDSGNELLKSIDFEFGGFKGAPKFPLPSALGLLLEQFRNTSEKNYYKALKISLDKMALGGIYDQIGGGFARYSTDREWRIPHFEKMLYDNGQLLSVYAGAYKAIRSELYKNVIYETAEFLNRELYISNKDEGIAGFCSSLDADSEGEEGKFYVWRIKEIEKAAGKDISLIEDYFNLNKEGNWERGNNILFRSQDESRFLRKYKISSDEMDNIIGQFRKKLFDIRENRTRPGRDTKIITSWNSLAITGLIDSYSAFNDKKFLKTAGSCLKFIENKMICKDGSIYRIFNSEKILPSINGFLDDYAFTIASMIKYYQVTFEEKWVYLAEKLIKYTIEHFYSSEGSMFYFKSDKDKALMVKNYEIQDNVIPSSNSVMAENLFYMGELLQNIFYSELSEKIVEKVSGNFIRNGVYFSRWCSLLGNQIYNPYEIVITGENALKFRDQIDRNFTHGAIYMGGVKGGTLPLLKSKIIDGKTMIYICKDRSCNIPVDNIDAALLQLNSKIK